MHVDFDIIPGTKAKADIFASWTYFASKLGSICAEKFKTKEQRAILMRSVDTDEGKFFQL